MTLKASSSPTRAAQYAPLIIAYRNGAPVRLRDIANVIDSVEDDKVGAWYNDARTISLNVFRQPGSNTVEVVDRVMALLPALRAAIPPTVNIDVIIDRSEAVRAAVTDVEFTLAITSTLVVLVILLFLRKASATLIPALALPLSVFGTFAAMKLCGFIPLPYQSDLAM